MLRRKAFFLNEDGCNLSNFHQQFEVLRRNDPSIERVDTVYFSRAMDSSSSSETCMGYGPALGEALVDNTTVNRLDLNPRTFFSNDPDDRASRHLYDSTRETFFDAIGPLMIFIGTSVSLHTVRLVQPLPRGYLSNDFVFEEIVRLVAGHMIAAALRNPQVTTLIVHGNIPLEQFEKSLETTSSIAKLVLDGDFVSSFGYPVNFTFDEDFDELIFPFVEQLIKYTSLQEWRLMKNARTFGLVTKAIQRLEHLRPESSLRLAVSTDSPGNLYYAPRSESALGTFAFYNTAFSEWNTVVENLQRHQSLTRLELHNCSFTTEVQQAFLTFVQTKANRDGSNLCELHLVSESPNTMFESMDFGQAICTMLDGSALSRLKVEQRWTNEPPLSPFLYRLVLDHSKSTLRAAWQDSVKSDIDGPMLALYIDKSTCTLSELGELLKLPSSNDDPTTKLTSLRHHGSLLYASVLDVGPNFIWNEREIQRVHAYCDRNANLSTLLTMDHGIGVDRAANQALLPSLLRVAQDMPRTAPTNLRLGLLSLSNDSS